MQYTKSFKIPYFTLGNVTNYYFPCRKFKSEPIYLSQMPTPNFSIVTVQCKQIIYLKFFLFN